ncbi:MAG: C25 family cysteine peptidase [candidate division Zixibacteria bacterium]
MRVIYYSLLAIMTAATGMAEVTSVVLEPANADMSTVQKHRADLFQADLGFRLSGVEVETVENNGAVYHAITPLGGDVEIYGKTAEEGQPELPIYAHFIGIPDQSAVNVEIISFSYEIIDDYNIMPVQTPTIEGSSDILPFVKDESFYQRDEFYPSEVIQVAEPMIYRDLRIAQIILSPFQYNPVTRQLKVYTSIDYNIVFEGFDNRNAKIRRSNRIEESYLPLYRAIVPNADELLSVYEPVRGGYLIITPDAFADTAAVLGRWKHLKGYDVVIATESDIDPNGNSPTYGEIKNYIQNAYDTWELPPAYICILGDRDGTYSVSDYPFGGYASDHQYACVDGNDIHPDIMVSRMSVASLSQLRVAMHKALRFDGDPYMGDPDYYLRALSSAGNIGSVTPRLTVLWVRNKLLQLGYNRVDTVFAWSTGDPGADEIQASMSNGLSLISYRGWGFPSQWGAPVFPTSRIDQLTHGWKIGICLAITCGIGNFGYAECWGERWIRAGSVTYPKGGPAFFGSTDGGTHTKWNNPIMLGYYWGLFEEGIYNFGLAAARGKLNQFNAFPNQFSSVNKYHHTYNTLGEPEMDIRTAIPRYLDVTYPSTIPVGTNMLEVNVALSGGLPLEGAYVNLLKGYDANEEVFVGGRTDASGNILLHFDTTVPDTMFVTVTGRNCVPHREYTLVQTQAVAVGINATAIDDDNSGNSSGNSDGNVNPSETVEFGITLRNFGNSNTATNVEATLSCTDPSVTITVPNQSYGSIAPGNNANSGSFAASFDPDIPHNDHIVLQLDIDSDQGSWAAAVPIDVKSMYFLHTDTDYPGNVNGRLDPGESSSLVFELQNIGELGGTSLSGVLSTSNPLVTITDNTAVFGNIGIGETGSNSGSTFEVEVDAEIYNGANVNFDLEMTSSNGSVSTRSLPVSIGFVASYDPVGPDNYGYYMYDNTDAGYSQAPFYNWTEIASGLGTRVNFSGNTDDNSSVVDLPFDFVYYGESYDYLLVCINGFVAFDTSIIDMGGNRFSNSHNMPIPDVGAPFGLIGPFWDDIEYNNSGDNGVFEYYDSFNHRYILEWHDCTHASTGSPETFQMIIYDPVYYPTPTGDAEIVFQYQTINNNDAGGGNSPGLHSSVGFQNIGNNDGLQYTFDNMYHAGAATLASGRAIKITTDTGLAPPPDIEYDPSEIHTWAEVDEIVTETIDISNIGEGTLVFSLETIADDRRRLLYDDPDESVIQAEPIGYTERPANKEGDRIEEIYPPVITDFGGPDGFGNRWIDSDEFGGPVYSWVDISGVGNEVYISEDGSSGPHNLGFAFPFYGNNVSSIYINDNGNLTFDGGSGVYNNVSIPNSAEPNNMLAVYWDDLTVSYGHVYYYQDTANNRFIVSFVDVANYGSGGELNFQAILYPSGQVIFQYGSLDPGGDNLYGNTIGIEDASGNDGLQIAFDQVYVHEQLAVRIYPPVFWLSSNIHGGVLATGEEITATITFDATDLEERDYTGDIRITCNDPTESLINIPVTLSVGGGPVCEYFIGDYNGSESFNVADVIAAFSKLKTGAPEANYLCECPFGSGNFWAVAMDLNNSCSFNIADVIAGFSKLKVGTPELVPCEDCPPGGRLRPGGNDRPLIVPILDSQMKNRKSMR